MAYYLHELCFQYTIYVLCRQRALYESPKVLLRLGSWIHRPDSEDCVLYENRIFLQSYFVLYNEHGEIVFYRVTDILTKNSTFIALQNFPQELISIVYNTVVFNFVSQFIRILRNFSFIRRAASYNGWWICPEIFVSHRILYICTLQ